MPKSNDYRRRNAHKVRMARLKRDYGITEERYTQLLDGQCGRCALCGRSSGGRNRALAVDHDHKNGKARGLLCLGCNSKLSVFEDARFGYLATRYLDYYKYIHNLPDAVASANNDPISLLDM